MKKLIFVALITGSLLNVSCKKDPADAPAIPPESSMNIDFDSFSSSSKTDSANTGEGNYWLTSATHVLVWNVILGVQLAVPVASFNESFNHTPKWVSKKKGWLWQYTVNHSTGVYTAKLYGKQETGEVHWRMLISKAGVFEDVEWYTGVSQNDNKSGTWSLNYDALNPKTYMNVTWSVDGDKKDIKFTNVESGADGYGSYIEANVDPSRELDRNYNIYGSKEDNLVNIEWNKTSRIGRIKAPYIYNDSDYRCWNENLLNTTCE